MEFLLLTHRAASVHFGGCVQSPKRTRPFYPSMSPDFGKSLLPSPNWTRPYACDILSWRSSPQASDKKRQGIMDDKIFASARMTAALDDDQAAYEAIPSVNIFDKGPDFKRPTNAIVEGVSRPRRRVGRWVFLLPVMAAAGFFLVACQGGGY